MQWDQVLELLSNSIYVFFLVLGAVIFAYIADKRAHIVQSKEHEVQSKEHEVQSKEHEVQSKEHESIREKVGSAGEKIEKDIVHTKEVIGTGISGIAQKVDDIGKVVGDIHSHYEVQKAAHENFDDTQKDIMTSVRKIEGLGWQLERLSNENRELKSQLQMVQQRNLKLEKEVSAMQCMMNQYQEETDWEPER